MVDITHSYNMNLSTISTILKNKDKIMEHGEFAVNMMLTIILKKCEKVLSTWMYDQYQLRVPLSLVLIQEKAKIFYEDLKKKHSKESEDISFNATYG